MIERILVTLGGSVAAENVRRNESVGASVAESPVPVLAGAERRSVRRPGFAARRTQAWTAPPRPAL